MNGSLDWGQCSMEGVYVFAPLFNRLSKGIMQREFKVKVCLQGYNSSSACVCVQNTLFILWSIEQGVQAIGEGVCRS